MSRIIARTIPASVVAHERERLRQALRAGGHDLADRLDLMPLACAAVSEAIHDAAVSQGVDGYEVHHDLEEAGDLAVTIVCASDLDALALRMAL